jgi:hypothetical protein
MIKSVVVNPAKHGWHSLNLAPLASGWFGSLGFAVKDITGIPKEPLVFLEA